MEHLLAELEEKNEALGWALSDAVIANRKRTHVEQEQSPPPSPAAEGSSLSSSRDVASEALREVKRLKAKVEADADDSPELPVEALASSEKELEVGEELVVTKQGVWFGCSGIVHRASRNQVVFLAGFRLLLLLLLQDKYL